MEFNDFEDMQVPLKMTRGQRIQEPSKNGPFSHMSAEEVNERFITFFRNGPGSLVTGNC